MGLFSSKSETKTAENHGQMQNNLTIGNTVDVYSHENTILLGLICAIKIIELIIFIVKSCKRNIKKTIGLSRQDP